LKKVSRHDPVITLSDYCRLHAVIRAVLDGVDARTTKACVFFAMAGAYLLKVHHKLDATPIAGGAFYGFGGDPPDVLTYAKREDDAWCSDADAFHCWIECGGWVIDLTAPLFPIAAAEAGLSKPLPQRMFQRPLAHMATDVDDVRDAGTFLFARNPPLTLHLLNNATKSAQTGDLVEACSHWYRRAPKPIATELALGSNDGEIRSLLLRLPELDGAWR
jgi:hypothetical protein